MSTGFSFGGANPATNAATAGAATAGFNFGKPATAAPSTGFSLGTAAPATGTAPGGGFGFGAATTSAGTGVGFGTSTPAAKPGLGLATTTTAPAAATGFGASSGLAGFGTAAATSKPATTGLTLGAPGFTGAGFGAGGTGLGQPAKTATASTGLAGFGATAAATAKPAGFGGFATATSATSGLTAGGNLFATPASTTQSRGLGGVDSKTTTTTTGTTGNNGKQGDSKAIKDTSLPGEIAAHVEEFKSFVKEQRNTSEEIDRMSSKQLYKIQEDVASLRQLLSLVSTGLQKNAVAIESIKQDSAKELKSAEIAQRTRDLPPGLQYENTAPSEYFARMAEDFEARMVTYRQHIEELESHLSSLHQPATLTPQELAILLKKISESFIHVAAQVHVINEAVKVQKQQYLNYRKIFYGDSSDIFEKRKKAVEKTKSKRLTDITGPTPFTGMSNAAALAMASVLNRQQQPGAVPTLGLNAGLANPQLGGQATGFSAGLGAGSIFGNTSTGTSGTGLGTTGFGTGGFGATTTQASTGFGSSGFNFGGATSGNTATVRPLGSTFGSTGTSTGGGLFGASSAGTGTATGVFGSPSQPGLAAGTTPGFGLQTNNAFGQPDNKAPFLLQKPPLGNKKGKKV